MKNLIKKAKIIERKKNGQLTHLKSHIDEEIYLGDDGMGGCFTCSEHVFDQILLDDDEIEYLGWKPYKDYLIKQGLISQAEINTKKTEPANIALIEARRAKILERLNTKPELKSLFNQIRAKHGKPPIS